MDPPANLEDLVSEFAGITSASPIVADHYLSACNYDLNRAIEFYFEHPPVPTQAGPRAAEPDEEAAALGPAFGDGNAGLAGAGIAQRAAAAAPGPGTADDDEELQRALVASMADAEAGPSRRGGPAGQSAWQLRNEDVQVMDEDEYMPGADEMLEAMARQGEAARAAEREARARMEEMMDRMIGGLGGRPSGPIGMPPGYPLVAGDPLAGVASIFPGMGLGLGAGPRLPPQGLPRFSGGPPGRGGGGDGSRGHEGGARARDGSGGGSSGAGQARRRRVEVQPGGESAAAGSGRGDGGWNDDELELPEGMSRHELEEARMMEAALLGVPYEGPLRDFSARGGGGLGGFDDREVAPEVLEHRELRWDQDRAYEESLAADRAKEQAAARAKAEAEASERAQREAEAAAERAAEEKSARLAALVATKAGRLPPEPPPSAADAITVMVRLPDGSRHSRRFGCSDRLSSLFDFVDVELDSTAKAAAAGAEAVAAQAQAALKPGTYYLVAQFPRRVFSEEESGGRTFKEAGLAGGGGAAFFIEQKGA